VVVVETELGLLARKSNDGVVTQRSGRWRDSVPREGGSGGHFSRLRAFWDRGARSSAAERVEELREMGRSRLVIIRGWQLLGSLGCSLSTQNVEGE